jgi:hypothetical protein
MVILFTCPGCNATHQFTGNGAEKSTRCQCRPAPLVVPAGSSADPSRCQRRQGNLLTIAALVLAGLGLLLALVALGLSGYSLFRDPLTKNERALLKLVNSQGLDAYDMSTAGNAYKAHLKMKHNLDVRAVLELEKRRSDKELKEMIDSLEIKKSVDVKLPEMRYDDQGKEEKTGKTKEYTFLFISYKAQGESKFRVQAMEKHDNGLWMDAYVGDYQVEKVDKDLAKEMKEWGKKK